MKARNQYLICLAVMLCVQIILMTYFGFQKQNLHVDEYFSYYSTSDNNFYVNLQDREWNPGNIAIKKCIVDLDDRFDYKNVYEMEAKDVHPPLYYYCLHTVCSIIIPEVFSKWTGLGLNIFFFALSFIILGNITWLLSEGNHKMVLAVNLFYGFNPAVISLVMFIRMYMLLTVLIMLFVYIHLLIVKAEYRLSIKRILAIAAVSFAGFLTHYYFLIFAGIFAAVFAVAAWIRTRRVKVNLLNFGSFLLGTGLAVLYYPVCIEHIFFGYRGTGAQASFLDISNTLYRLRYFTHLTSRFAFAGCMKEILAAILVITASAGIVLFLKRKEGMWRKCSFIWSGAWIAMILAAAGYYILVVKTALTNEDEMVRYVIPVYAFFFLILIAFLSMAGKILLSDERTRKKAGTVLLLGGMLLNVYGMSRGNILFLYPESKERIAFAKENSNAAVVQIYGNEGWTWEIAGELESYPEIYCVSGSNLSRIEDERIENSDKIVVYIDHTDAQIEQRGIELILESNDKVTRYEKHFETVYYDIYLFQ